MGRGGTRSLYFIGDGQPPKLRIFVENTGYPYLDEMIGKGIEAIEEAEFLTDEQKRDILYNNATRFLQMDTKP